MCCCLCLQGFNFLSSDIWVILHPKSFECQTLDPLERRLLKFSISETTAAIMVILNLLYWITMVVRQNVLQHNPLLCFPFSYSVCCKHTDLVRIRLFTLLQVELRSFRKGGTVTWEELLVVDYDSGVLMGLMGRFSSTLNIFSYYIQFCRCFCPKGLTINALNLDRSKCEM